jgi:hypothetical protein
MKSTHLIQSLLAIIIIAGFAILLTGCSGMAKFQNALAKDQATFSTKTTTVYGTFTLGRVGKVDPGTKVTVTPEGNISVERAADAAATAATGGSPAGAAAEKVDKQVIGGVAGTQGTATAGAPASQLPAAPAPDLRPEAQPTPASGGR